MPEWMKNTLLALFALLVVVGGVFAVHPAGGPAASPTASPVYEQHPTPSATAAGPVLASATCNDEQSALSRAAVPSGTGPVAVFLGDSYTYGLGAPAGADYATVTAKAEGWRAVRLGLVGSGFIAYRQCGVLPLSSQIARVVSLRPSILVIQAGLNDNRNGDTVRDSAARAASLLAKLGRRLPAAKVFLIGPAAPMSSDRERSALLDPELRAVAAAHGAVYVSWLHSLDAAGAVSSDGTHPSQLGHLTLAEALQNAVKG